MNMHDTYLNMLSEAGFKYLSGGKHFIYSCNKPWSKFCKAERNNLSMKKLILSFLTLLIFFNVNAQDSLGSITELQRLLKERRDRFDAYATSADQKSGIFGNKTKKDLEESRTILLEIVKTDNQLLNELDRAISRRGIAKADYSVAEVGYRETIDRLSQAVDTLNKQLIAERELSASFQHKTESGQWFLYLLLAIIAVLVAILLRRKR
jgi:hypothetical protein